MRDSLAEYCRSLSGPLLACQPQVQAMQHDDDISPYLKRPLRSLDEVLRRRRDAPADPSAPANNDRPLPAAPPAKSA